MLWMTPSHGAITGSLLFNFTTNGNAQLLTERFRGIVEDPALLGALPLALGSGDGAELRRPLGISIVGGLMLSQLLTLYTTPVVYLTLDRLRLWIGGKRRPAQAPVAIATP